MSKYLPPMSGGQEPRVAPGPVRGGACPPPSEIVVIEARKVFDFCFQEDVIERSFFVPNLAANTSVVSCEITDVECSEIDREPIPDQDGLVLVTMRVILRLEITLATPGGRNPVIVRRVRFVKRAVLCAPTGTDVVCDVRGTCVCDVQPLENGQNGENGQCCQDNIFCTIQLCIVLQTLADVKLLVPTFGVVVPQQCRVSAAFGGCPPIPQEVCGPQINIPTEGSGT